MRIKRLEICGFKSFVDRTVLTFDEPITGVVGPNGCGKSNIVDSIRWVMGEQSAKHLRGRAMEDVIFNGSESRGPAGMAEVSVTFDTHALDGEISPGGVPWGAVGPTDVVVTRRLYRGGESEYLLGGVPCRLRDIVEFFLGTGVGSKAYAIIEQGRIGFIVSSRPEERRTLIDEAAGITKYKAKKKIAERRMEATRQHLLRVSDIIGELETRLRSLKLQAQKAERYKRYKAELKSLELTAATQKYLGFVAEAKCLAEAWEKSESAVQSETTSVRTEETIVETERLALAAEVGEVSRSKEELFALTNRAQLASQRADHYRDEAGMLVGRAEHAQREIEAIEQNTEQNLGALSELESQVQIYDEEADARAQALAEMEVVVSDRRADLVSLRRQYDESTQALSSATARIARLESELDSARMRTADLAHRQGEMEEENGSLDEQRASLDTEIALVEEKLAELQGATQAVAQEKAELEQTIAQLRDAVSKGEMELETLREEAHRRRSRLQSLSEIQDRYESFQRGVRAIMQRVRDSGTELGPASDEQRPAWATTGIRGLVADIVQPPPELETALEAVLGERLGTIIVESHEVGVEAIDYLKQQSEGRSSFLPVGAFRSLGPIPEAADPNPGAMEILDPPATASDWPRSEGVRGPMLELIGYDRGYHRIANYLLGDVLVVGNLHQALELWRTAQTDKTIVTLDGEVIDPHGIVTGGSRESAVAGVLAQKREMRELEAVVAQLEVDYQTALARHVANKQALAQATSAVEACTEQGRQTELGRVASQKDQERFLRERQQVAQRQAQLGHSLESLQSSIEQNQTRQAEALAQLTEAQLSIATCESSVTDLRAKVEAEAEAVDRAMAELSTVKVSASQSADRKRNARESMERLRRTVEENSSRRQRLFDESRADFERAEKLRAESEQLQAEAGSLQDEINQRSSSLAERQDAVEERSGNLARREADLKSLRSQLTKLTQELGALEIHREQVRMRMESLDEQVHERYPEVGKVAELFSDYHLSALSGEKEESRIRELRGLVERMGDINLTAIEEADELQKRFDFLSAQKADLESAISQLESAIEKINRASRKRFREVYDAVNAKFQEVFPNLFGGGRAYLALTDESDMLETGVEIVANPPGKKLMQNIELLSGGEKALTAVSLLFAIFLVKPSPFCVLDEVDAPLDEANVGRFNNAVREMTDRSQFIIVTHNQRTMETADRLCGVTMEESGVSKLVAVNLRGKTKSTTPVPSSLTEPPSLGGEGPAASA